MNYPMTSDLLLDGMDPRQALTVAELKMVLSHLPERTASGAPTRVLLAIDHNTLSPLTLCDGVMLPGGTDVHVRLLPALRERDPGDDSAKATAVDLALAVCSYLRFTPVELFDEAYCEELVDRAQEALDGLKRAQHGLAASVALQPVQQTAAILPLPLRLVVAPWLALRTMVAPPHGLSLSGRLQLVWITFSELLKP